MKIYTTDEIAEYLRIKPGTVRGLIRDNRLTAIKIGNEYRITEEQLQEFITKNTTNK